MSSVPNPSLNVVKTKFVFSISPIGCCGCDTESPPAGNVVQALCTLHVVLALWCHLSALTNPPPALLVPGFWVWWYLL
jgi:hypothetical protein